MKNLTIAIAILLLFSSSLQSQEINKGLYITFKGGLTLANQYGRDVELNLQQKTGQFY